MDGISLEDALQQMKALQDRDDFDVAHLEADGILCDFLRSQGYDQLVDLFEGVGKWYE